MRPPSKSKAFPRMSSGGVKRPDNTSGNAGAISRIDVRRPRRPTIAQPKGTGLGLAQAARGTREGRQGALFIHDAVALLPPNRLSTKSASGCFEFWFDRYQILLAGLFAIAALTRASSRCSAKEGTLCVARAFYFQIRRTRNAYHQSFARFSRSAMLHRLCGSAALWRSSAVTRDEPIQLRNVWNTKRTRPGKSDG